MCKIELVEMVHNIYAKKLKLRNFISTLQKFESLKKTKTLIMWLTDRQVCCIALLDELKV